MALEEELNEEEKESVNTLVSKEMYIPPKLMRDRASLRIHNTIDVNLNTHTQTPCIYIDAT